MRKLPQKIKPITVKETLRNLHPLVKKTYDALTKGELNKYNRVQVYGGGYLDVLVGPDSVKRAMCILDALVKELNRQGIQVETEAARFADKAFVRIGEEKVYFWMREGGYREPDPYESRSSIEYKYFTNGELSICLCERSVGSPHKTIRDLKTKRLEDRLDEFLPKLFSLAEKMRKERLEYEEWYRQREEEERIKEEAERKRKAELKRRKKLEEQAELFTKSRYIYDFITEIEKQKAQLDLDEDGDKRFEEWITWAKEHADRLNPSIQVLRQLQELDDEESPATE